jgi:hypothetical protein
MSGIILLYPLHSVAATWSSAPINQASWSEADQVSLLNVIYKPNPPVVEVGQPSPQRVVTTRAKTSIRAATTMPDEALRQYLESKGSPLSDYVQELLESPYWSTIIWICTIEEYSCSVNPHDSNNLWGIMCSGSICSYPSLEAGIAAIDAFLRKAESNGRDTIEEFRGWYCVNDKYPGKICPNWESVVLRTKSQLESLE